MVRFVPLIERHGVDFNDRALPEGVCPDEFVVDALSTQIQAHNIQSVNRRNGVATQGVYARHRSDKSYLTHPCKVAVGEAKSAVLCVSTASTDCVNACGTGLDAGGPTAKTKCSPFAGVWASNSRGERSWRETRETQKTVGLALHIYNGESRVLGDWIRGSSSAPGTFGDEDAHLWLLAYRFLAGKEGRRGRSAQNNTRAGRPPRHSSSRRVLASSASARWSNSLSSKFFRYKPGLIGLL